VIFGILFLVLGVLSVYGSARIRRFVPSDFPGVASEGFEKARGLQLQILNFAMVWCFGLFALSMLAVVTELVALRVVYALYLFGGLIIMLHLGSKASKLNKAVGITRWRKPQHRG
jgi:hypothetical protein